MKSEDVTAFFTEKAEGADPARISLLSGFSEDLIFFPVQRHTERVILLEKMESEFVGDAAITSARGILVGIKVADCLPVLIYDRVRRVAGAVHAGWRGTAAGILKKAIRRFTSGFHSAPGDILISMGPSIRWCCYRVDGEVLEAVMKETGEGEYHLIRDGGICLDLASANRLQAVKEGIPEENIWISGDCTFCYPEKFNSFRYDGTSERQGGFIGLNP